MMANWRSPLMRPLSVALVFWGGCKGTDKFPDGFCLVREHVVWAPSNIPPIESELDCSLLEVDGAPPQRKPRTKLDDGDPDALIPSGFHHFKARATPWRMPPDAVRHEMFFDASVEGGKEYYLVEKATQLVFVEARVTPK